MAEGGGERRPYTDFVEKLNVSVTRLLRPGWAKRGRSAR
jgi:hypothetical protein